MRNSIVSLFYGPLKYPALLDVIVAWALFFTVLFPVLNIPYDGQILVYMLMEIRNSLISGGVI